MCVPVDDDGVRGCVVLVATGTVFEATAADEFVGEKDSTEVRVFACPLIGDQLRGREGGRERERGRGGERGREGEREGDSIRKSYAVHCNSVSHKNSIYSKLQIEQQPQITSLTDQHPSTRCRYRDTISQTNGHIFC